jgi:phage protein D
MSQAKGLPRVRVTLNGQDLEALGYAGQLSGVEVRLKEGAISTAKIVLANPRDSITGDRRFREDAQVTVEMGYGDNLGFMGNFFLTNPSNAIGVEKNNVTLFCYGEAIKATRIERRRQFGSVRISGLAERIAAEEGWAAEVIRSETIYETLTQLNESNLRFLDRLGRKLGYFIEVFDGTLRFGPRRNDRSGLIFTKSMSGDDLALRRLIPEGTALKAAANIIATGFDPRSKQIVKADAGTVSDEGPMRAIKESREGKGDSAEVIVWGVNDRRKIPSVFLRPGWAIRGSADEAREFVRGQWRNRRWPIKADAVVDGHPKLLPGSLITLENVDIWSGQWFVEEACHKFFGSSTGYTAEACLLSSSRGKLVEGQPYDDTVERPQDVTDMRPIEQGGRLVGSYEVQ